MLMFGRRKKGDLTATNIEAGGNVTIQNKGGEGNIQAKDIRAQRDVLIGSSITYIQQPKPDEPPKSLPPKFAANALLVLFIPPPPMPGIIGCCCC